MISLHEFKKKYKRGTYEHKIRKYSKGLRSQFGLQMFEHPGHAFVDKIITKVIQRVSRLPDSDTKEQLNEFVRSGQFVREMLQNPYTNEEEFMSGEEKKNRVYNKAEEMYPGITETIEFQNVLSADFFERLWVDIGKYVEDGGEILSDHFVTKPGFPFFTWNETSFLGQTFRFTLIQELFEYRRRFNEQRRSGIAYYSAQSNAQLDLLNHESIVYPETIRVKELNGIIYILVGEIHTTTQCTPNSELGITPGKFFVDLVHSCPDVSFDLFVENSQNLLIPEDNKIFTKYADDDCEQYKMYGGSGFLDSMYLYFFPIYEPQNAWKNDILGDMQNVRVHNEDIRYRPGQYSSFKHPMLPEDDFDGVNFIEHVYAIQKRHRQVWKPFDRLIEKEYKKLHEENPSIAERLRRMFQEFYEEEREKVIKPGIKTVALIVDTLITDYYALLRAFRPMHTFATRQKVVMFYGGLHHVQNWSVALTRLGATDYGLPSFDKVQETLGIYSKYEPLLNLRDLMSQLETLGVFRHRFVFEDDEQRLIQEVYSVLDEIKRSILLTTEDLSDALEKLDRIITMIPEIPKEFRDFLSLKIECVIDMLEIEINNYKYSTRSSRRLLKTLNTLRERIG